MLCEIWWQTAFCVLEQNMEPKTKPLKMPGFVVVKFGERAAMCLTVFSFEPHTQMEIPLVQSWLIVCH